MAVQSTLAAPLSPVDPTVYDAVRRAHRPPRRLWIFVIRLILQYVVTVPGVVIATPFIILRNIIPWLRKHPAWSFKTAVSTTIVRVVIVCMGMIRFCPLPRAEDGWLQGNSAAGYLITALVEMLTWGSFGSTIWADSKNVPHLSHLHGRRLDLVWVSPPPVDWLRGLLAVRDPNQPLEDQLSYSPLYRGRPMIQPGFAKRKVKCYWYLSNGTKTPPHPHDNIPKRTKPVMLYTHGGAGVSFSAGDAFMGATLAGFLSRTADIDVFTVDYDLGPYAKYPTTIAQLFGAWLYLVMEVGYHPSQIFMGGDSYGGMSTLLFDRYLRDVWPHLEPPTPQSLLAVEPTLSDIEVTARIAKFTEVLGAPGRSPVPTPGLVLLSPWLHVSDLGELFPSRRKAVNHDIVTLQFMRWGTDCLEMTSQHFKTNLLPQTSPWISPYYMSSAELATLPPIWLGNGGAEALLDEGTEFVRRARAAGCDAEHFVQAGMPHDFYSIPFEINNSKIAYNLLKPWLITHYRRVTQAQAIAPPTPATEPMVLEKQPSNVDIEAQSVEQPCYPTESQDTLTESKDLGASKDTLAESGVVVPTPVPHDAENQSEAKSNHPPAPASIATTDDAAFESAVEPESRPTSPKPQEREEPVLEQPLLKPGQAPQPQPTTIEEPERAETPQPETEPAQAPEPTPVAEPISKKTQPKPSQPEQKSEPIKKSTTSTSKPAETPAPATAEPPKTTTKSTKSTKSKKTNKKR